MDVKSIIKYSRMSPKKVREVARELKGMFVSEALELLQFIPRKSAQLIRKALVSAHANAENNHNMAADDMVVDQVTVDQGPGFKRFRAGARGSAKPYKKRTSHITVTLKDKATSN